MIRRRADVCAILEDPRFEVPTVPSARTGMGWLRATVSRFANGDVHARRRALVEKELDALSPSELRTMARGGADSFDARDVPLAVLCSSLGVDWVALPQAVADAGVVSTAYPLGSDASEAADAAVRRLVALLGPTADEETAARIALLAQAGSATGALIESALERLRAEPSRPVEDVLADTLGSTPPVTTTQRVRDGETVLLDLAAARLPFGHGPRACPGQEHALALAAGVLDAQAASVK